MIGPKLHENDFQFLIKKYFLMDIFCLLTGTANFNMQTSLLSNEDPLKWKEWSILSQRSYLTDPSKRTEQRLLRFKELEKLHTTENDLQNLQRQLEDYKIKLKEATDEISYCKRMLNLSERRQNYLPNMFQQFEDQKSHLPKKKFATHARAITLFKNVANNHNNSDNSKPLKQSQFTETENNDKTV
ncbi:unnamed protein product [Trichobilharzia szidati]|nr:unnamed protein product [Trichobilharzia szidati]